MIHYLRDKHGDNIVDIESMASDLRALVDIKPFSNFLLSLKEEQRQDFIKDMYYIQEIRGVYHENGLESQMYHTSVLVKQVLPDLATKWGLYYVED